ncbi:DUF5667 domain-containing protein [Clostridium sp. CX1]|uniref:DUF5667 domain-containing protein n=1 Tax=Clostridium sp. CX1 TaxID=2978346 RepID=UPI0021BF80F0|nr:DUF5667 domain-containing protein [Clostridium sp. CX1]MCT8975629.1 DUF5667 domain-containing protein [Clostridium sp. CX1]
MKKIALFVTALAVSLSLGGRAFADTTAESLADKAGITPDNTILYPVDQALDNLKIDMASGEEKEAEALVEVAEERLGESEVMVTENNGELSTEALNEYNEKMTEAQDKVDSAIEKATDGTTDSAIKLEDLEKLETTIADKQTKSIEVLKGIESKVSGNAKETLALVIEMQTRKKEAVAAVAQERQTLIQNKQAVKTAEKNLEQAKKAGDQQAVKTAEESLKQAQQALATQTEKFNQVVATKKEAMKGGVGQLKKQANKEKKEEAKDDTTPQEGTTTENKDTSTVTAPAENSETTTKTDGTETTTTTEAPVNNDSTVTNTTKVDVTEKVNKGQEVKTNKENNSSKENNAKENKGQQIKSDKENNSSKENKSNH